MKNTLVLALLAGLSSAPACSLLFVEGPAAQRSRSQPLTCSTSYGWPVFDTIMAGFQSVRAGLALSHSDAYYKGMPISRGGDIGFGVSLAALSAISAGFGYDAVGRCHAARDAAYDSAAPPTAGAGLPPASLGPLVGPPPPPSALPPAVDPDATPL